MQGTRHSMQALECNPAKVHAGPHKNSLRGPRSYGHGSLLRCAAYQSPAASELLKRAYAAHGHYQQKDRVVPAAQEREKRRLKIELHALICALTSSCVMITVCDSPDWPAYPCLSCVLHLSQAVLERFVPYQAGPAESAQLVQVPAKWHFLLYWCSASVYWRGS